jgi:hypothetical protein
LAVAFLEKTQFIYNDFDKRRAKEKLSKRGDLVRAYAALDSPLRDALDFTAFEDLLPDLEQEAKDTKAILDAITAFAQMTDEQDWCGAFVTIRGMSIITGLYWLEINPEKDFEDTVIQGLSYHLEANFSSSRCTVPIMIITPMIPYQNTNRK